jgi:hypothetical protein
MSVYDHFDGQPVQPTSELFGPSQHDPPAPDSGPAHTPGAAAAAAHGNGAEASVAGLPASLAGELTKLFGHYAVPWNKPVDAGGGGV